ncbi:MAG: DUF3306 domain-containing protein [Burkholderiales bacterium]
MKDDRESFIRRWARLKNTEPAPAQPEAKDEEPPVLPSIDDLTPESDFSAFMHPKVDDDVRQAALKKLFTSARYQAMDGLDVYIGDYSTPDPLPPALLAGLAHAQALLGREDAGTGKNETESGPASAPERHPVQMESDEAARASADSGTDKESEEKNHG